MVPPHKLTVRLKETDTYRSELDEGVSIPREERMVIVSDFSGYADEGKRDDEAVFGRFEVEEWNLEGQMIVGFAKKTNNGNGCGE